MSAEVDPPERLNLYELARLNGDSMRERYQQTRHRSAGAADAVERFCQRVEREARACIITRSGRLLWMVRNGYYPNPHSDARERARREGGDSEEYLKRQQGAYYRKRVMFETLVRGWREVSLCLAQHRRHRALLLWSLLPRAARSGRWRPGGAATSEQPRAVRERRGRRTTTR